MKNFIKENWFKIFIVLMIIYTVGVYSYHEFKPKSFQEKAMDCLKLDSIEQTTACVGMLNIIKNKESKNAYLTYNQIIDSDNQFLGETIIWQGKVASELSQNDGIKFWIDDDENKDRTMWFWAYDENTLSLPEEADGKWVTYLMEKYIGTYNYNYDDMFEIKGVVDELDCNFYEDTCIPNIKLIEINKL